MPRRQQNIAADKIVATQVFADTLSATSSTKTVESLTESTTLDVNDSGKIFTLDLAAGAVAVTLPTPVAAGAGWNVTIIQNVTDPTAPNTVVGATNIYGSVAASDGTATAVATGETTISFIATSDEGDMVHLISTGTKYIVSGLCAINTSITIVA